MPQLFQYALLKLGAKNVVLHSEVIVLLGEVLLEELLNLDEKGKACQLIWLTLYRVSGRCGPFWGLLGQSNHWNVEHSRRETIPFLISVNN